MTQNQILGQKTVNLGLNLKNGISNNLGEWYMSKDNFYVMINNREGEEFSAKLVFFIIDEFGTKKQILDFKKLPLLTIGNGINYFLASEVLPSISFDAPFVLTQDITFRAELIPMKQKDFDFAALSDIKLKVHRTNIKSLSDDKSEYVVSWDSQIKPSVEYNLAIQGKGPQSGIVYSSVNMKLNETYFVNVSNNIPTETYYEVDDANTAYASDPKYILTEELYTMIDIMDPKILEILDNKKAITKIKVVIDYIDKLRSNTGYTEADIMANLNKDVMVIENKKSDYVVQSTDHEIMNARILEIYDNLDNLKSKLKPANTTLENLTIINEFKDLLYQLMKCKKAIDPLSFATN